ncbi:hypothetical protein WOLCODRAFT_151788 [Wolfiporia cocos MD-104 SS10]|uniref:Uncharacterized protein n=1 Tax=Wolfiporia cocos (strain MD-104) TaxID=742152 RepID=A0A2H3JHS7_WOLCO|nr:hypothetical protein WOLCODRAFT_151788 [Wolfiporia cocos MD-104 SS10]
MDETSFPRVELDERPKLDAQELAFPKSQSGITDDDALNRHVKHSSGGVQEFWQLGYRLFNSSADTFPVPFVAGDAFDETFLRAVSPYYTLPKEPAPPLSSLTNLTPLLGLVSAIHVSSFFHLFDEAHQLQLAKSLAGLLSPLPGSMIFGAHGGLPEKGLQIGEDDQSKVGSYMFCHSPESWGELWNGQVFECGTVNVEAIWKPGIG